ncbi:MAG: sigma-70 family RNA polymerase sigma factor [Ruminococcus sp.]|nr:sigma-70 family RNA polymerase sigma factor [Ruminococcus sp.]
MTDEQIIDRMKGDDTGALDEAMRQYGGLVTGIAKKLLDDPADWEEVKADTFFKLWRYRFDIDPERRSLKGFICMIAKSCISDKLRYHNRIKRQEVIPPEENDLGIDVDYENNAAKKLNQQIIIACISTMTSPEKEVFIDRYYFNMPVKDIAKREGLKEKKVENILFRGKKKLKEALLKGGILL